jgi:purine-binding chemotaxis protein CheW
VATSQESPVVAPRRLFTFLIGERLCALPFEDIREVVPLAELSRPPGLPSILEGFLNLGGVTIAVVALRRLLGLEDRAPTLYAHLLVVGPAAAPLAFLTDYAHGAVEADVVRRIPPGRSPNDCITAEVVVDGRTIHVMATERLLLEEERARIAELRAVEQERRRRLQEP